MFRLERGATGFRHVTEPELPVVDLRLLRATGMVLGPPSLGSFHAAVLITPAGRFAVRCHRHHPWIAFIEGETYADPPAGVFLNPAFTLLGPEVLDLPLSAADTTALAKAEWTQIRYWQPETVGQTLFNSWD